MFRAHFKVDGMHCLMCEAQVKNLAMKADPASTFYASQRKSILVAEGATMPRVADIKEALASGGYTVTEADTEEFEEKKGFFERLFKGR